MVYVSDAGRFAEAIGLAALADIEVVARLITGTLALNVPVGFALLLDALRKDNDLKRRFFEDLDLMFYAAASLPKEVWGGLEEMAMSQYH